MGGGKYSAGSPSHLVTVKTWISKTGRVASAIASKNKIPWYERSVPLMQDSSYLSFLALAHKCG